MLVSKRLLKALVRATRSTTQLTGAVDEDLAVEQVVVRRVRIGQVVEAIPPIREESGVMIVPVVEEDRIEPGRDNVCREEVEMIPGTNASVAGFNIYSMVVAVIGAIVVLWLYHALVGRRTI